MSTTAILPGFTAPAAPTAAASGIPASASLFGDLMAAFTTGTTPDSGSGSEPEDEQPPAEPAPASSVTPETPPFQAQQECSAAWFPAFTTQLPAADPTALPQNLPADLAAADIAPGTIAVPVLDSAAGTTDRPPMAQRPAVVAPPVEQAALPVPGQQAAALHAVIPPRAAAPVQSGFCVAPAPLAESVHTVVDQATGPVWAQPVVPATETAVEPAASTVRAATLAPPLPAAAHQESAAAERAVLQPVRAETVAFPGASAEIVTAAPLPGFTEALRPASPAAPAAAPDVAPPPAPMSMQLSRPLFTLASAAPGEHVMTMKVTPEDLGPVTVRAHINSEGVRLELFAPGDAGREAIRAALPELRRDLSLQGMNASLDLSGRNSPSDQGGQPHQQEHPVRGPYRQDLRMVTHAEATPAVRPRPAAPDTALDVLA